MKPRVGEALASRFSNERRAAEAAPTRDACRDKMSRFRSPVTTTLLRQQNLRTFVHAVSSRSPLARSLLLPLQDGSNGGQRWKHGSCCHGWRRGRGIFFSRANGVRRFPAREDGSRVRGRVILPRGGASRDDRHLFPCMKRSPLSWPCLQRGEKVSVIFRRGGRGQAVRARSFQPRLPPSIPSLMLTGTNLLLAIDTQIFPA
jgi:hypothetical protein